MNGVLATPAPPLLLLLQQAQKREQIYRLQNENVKVTAAADNLAHENKLLLDSLEEINHIVEDLNTTNSILRNKLTNAEKETSRNHAEKTEYESKLKEHKKKHFEEVKVIQVQVKDLTKAIKSKEKEVHNLNRSLQNTRDALKNCKAEKSQLKTKQTKLEAEIRNLGRRECREKEINLESIKSEKIDINANIPKFEALDHDACSDSPSTIPIPTMVSHFDPNFSESIPRQANFISMVAHCFTTSNSISKSLSSETSENKFKNIELEEKEVGFIGPRLPRILTDEEFKSLLKKHLGNRYGV